LRLALAALGRPVGRSRRFASLLRNPRRPGADLGQRQAVGKK